MHTRQVCLCGGEKKRKGKGWRILSLQMERGCKAAALVTGCTASAVRHCRAALQLGQGYLQRELPCPAPGSGCRQWQPSADSPLVCCLHGCKTGFVVMLCTDQHQHSAKQEWDSGADRAALLAAVIFGALLDSPQLLQPRRKLSVHWVQ